MPLSHCHTILWSAGRPGGADQDSTCLSLRPGSPWMQNAVQPLTIENGHNFETPILFRMSRPTIGLFLTKYGTAKFLDWDGGCRITPASLTCSSLARWYRRIISHLKFTINLNTYSWPFPMMGLNLTSNSLTIWSQSSGSQIWVWIKVTWRIKVQIPDS